VRRRSQHTVDAPRPAELDQPLADALDHVVESLNSLSASVGSTSAKMEPNWSHPAWTTTVPARRRLVKAVSFFFLRFRLSRRRRYKLPRLVLAWTSLAAAVGAVVWIAFALRGRG
jgi:hypothetical protein